MILIGSRAIKYNRPDFYREPKDWDYVIDDELMASLSRADTHCSPEVYNALKPYCTMTPNGLVPSIDALYTLKVSHSFWNIFWLKTMKDIEWFQENGAKFIPELYTTLYAYWEIKHNKKRAYLNVKNEEFFTKSVDRIYIHDDVHLAIAYYDEPMYTKIKKDASKALVSKSMFEALSLEDRFKTCREEAYVTALERFILPGKVTNSEEAYKRAMHLLCTSMSKGWWPLFIVLHWKELQKPDIDYVDKFRRVEKLCRKINQA